ncbi:CRTAC1 family protein, partial [bacterium]|nr:CRTAC1 family protein [bacterium]
MPGVYAQTTFTKITTGAVVIDTMNAGSGNWVDYDNDGDLDLFVANVSDNNALYQNDGTGSFARITSGVIVNDGAGSSNWGDFDNDGDLDLFVASLPNRLYRNNGDGTFTRITAGEIVEESESTGLASWVDYDHDGDLDLFAIRTTQVLEGGASFLYQNNGDGSFTKITESVIVNDGGGEAALWADYDNDGDLDLFVTVASLDSRVSSNNRLYQNDGAGSFTRITTGEIVNGEAVSVGGSWGDYDNDGDLDLFVMNAEDSERNSLYQNNGNGTFFQIESGPIVEQSGQRSRGSSWADYDNDGDLDLFITNSLGNHVLYQNDGQGLFTELTDSELAADMNGNMPTWGDYDNDGDLDLFVARFGTSLLYENNGSNHNWIKIKCIGTLSNRSAIGARVRAKATLNGKAVQQVREISGRDGNSPEADFGLADASSVDSLVIRWPSGTLQVLTDVAVNQFLTVSEILPPRLEHTPVSTAESNQELVLEANVIAENLAETNLLFRRSGDAAFTAMPMADQGGGLFRATIPSGDVTARGVEYHIVAIDPFSNTGRLPTEGSFSVQVHVNEGLSKGVAQPFGSAQTAYRIFSVPLDLDDRSPQALFIDDLGEYDDTRWRFLEFVGNNTFLEFPDIAEIVSGKGYWFLVSEPARVIDTGPGTSITTAEEFAIPLHPGWNLIGNPFNFPIPIENLRLEDGSPVALRTFAGTDTASWNNPITNPVDKILPFEGYAVFNDSSVAANLLVNPDLSAPSSLTKKIEPKDSTDPFWTINVQAQCQQARDVDNVLGVAAQASESWDPLDFPEPPPIGQYVSVYFDHSESGKGSG